MPEQLRLELAQSFADTEAQQPRGVLNCDVGAGGAFTCKPPATQLDLRLATPGFAAHYVWGAALGTREPLDLGTLRLIPGASLSGWLLTEQGAPPKADEVELYAVPRGVADSSDLADKLLRRFMKHRGALRDNGFFLFDSLEAGDYVVVANGDGYAESRRAVSLVEGREAQLRDAMVLMPPLSVSLSVTPPTAPGGEPWRLNVWRIPEGRTTAETVVEADPVPTDGWYELDKVRPGMHVVWIADADGNNVASRQLRFDHSTPTVLIEIESVAVEGILTLGDKPLAATIWYGTRHGAERVQATSDEDGYYSATLPRAGSWRVDVEAGAAQDLKVPFVSVPEASGGDPVEVDIKLPDTRITGRVRLSDGGKPKTGTIVYAISDFIEFESTMRVDHDGEFEFIGLSPGPLRLHAWGAEGRSRPIELVLVEGREHEVELVLEPVIDIEGIVIGEFGPLPGAFVQLNAVQDPLIPILPAYTDGAGRFVVQNLPEATTTVTATVRSLGRTLTVVRRPVRPGENLVIELPTEGGTLTVDQNGARTDGPAAETLLFARDGVLFSKNEVRAWASLHRQPEETTQSFTAPALAPGFYEVCSVPIVEYSRWAYGYRDPRRCVSGHLPPLGQLELTLTPRETTTGGQTAGETRGDVHLPPP